MENTKVIIILDKRVKRRASSARLSAILEKYYGNILGTGQTDRCLKELVQDIQQFCKLTGRKSLVG